MQPTSDLLDLLQLYQQYYPQPSAEIQEQAEDIDLNFLMTDSPKILPSMKMGVEQIRDIAEGRSREAEGRR